MRDASRRSTPRLLALAVVLLLTVCVGIGVLVVSVPEVEDVAIASPYVLPEGVDPWAVGNEAFEDGDYERAAASWRQVPPEHPDYARAQRNIAWKVYASALGEPQRALAYARRSVLADPFSGNAWQDLARTWQAALQD